MLLLLCLAFQQSLTAPRFPFTHNISCSADHAAAAAGKKIERSLASFAPRYQRYVVKARSYTQQASGAAAAVAIY
jgi:hypothetical protein